MNRIDLANFNLNLLVALDALLGTRSVTAAAKRLRVTPSAMSHSLAELRDRLGDLLLVRSGRGMVLTPRAEALILPLRKVLVDSERLLGGGTTFDPLTAERRFVIAAPDFLANLLLPPLIGAPASKHPNGRRPMTMPAAFDPLKYKQTTRAQWDAAAEAWHRWGPTLREWLGPATERMLERAGVVSGCRVLDVAAGAGDQTLQAATRVGPGGSVLATDISPAILAFAASEAKRAGIANVATKAMDGENLELADASFDAVISRVGLIYFPDQQRALGEMRRVLVPGGRAAAIVYGPAEKNGFFSVPVGVVRRHARLGPPLAGQPGPFSLGGPGVAAAALRQAGFRDVTEDTVVAPLRMRSAAECLRFEQESFGALHQMLSSLDAAGREAAWAEVGRALGEFERGQDGFVGPCELVVVAGTK